MKWGIKEQRIHTLHTCCGTKVIARTTPDKGAEGDGEEVTACSRTCSKPKDDAPRLPMPTMLNQGTSEMVTTTPVRVSCSQLVCVFSVSFPGY